jgi:hypothetical protein
MPDRDQYEGTTGILSGADRRGVGFILKTGDLLQVAGDQQRAAATHLIAGFNIPCTEMGWGRGTVVCFEGNRYGTKAARCVRLGPQELGTAKGGFWMGLDDEIKRTARIDRQKYFPEKDIWFCDYHLQIGAVSHACVLVQVDFDVSVKNMRHAFHLSLERVKNVKIVAADNRSGFKREER